MKDNINKRRFAFKYKSYFALKYKSKLWRFTKVHLAFK